MLPRIGSVFAAYACRKRLTSPLTVPKAAINLNERAAYEDAEAFTAMKTCLADLPKRVRQLRRLRRLYFTILLSAFAVGSLNAGPITYTFTGPGTNGTLNGVAFSNQTATFTISTDGSVIGKCSTGCVSPVVIGGP